MRRRVVLALAWAMLSVGTTSGQSPEDEKVKVGDWAPDLEAKVWINAAGTLSAADEPSLREYRGLVTVIVFWVSHHEGGRYLLPYINVADYGGRFGGSGLTFVGVTDADRKRTEDWLRESKIFFPVGCESNAAEDYGITEFPSIVIVDPEGKVAFKGAPSENFFSAIGDVQEKTPPTRTNPEEAARSATWLDDAREKIRAGNFRRAYVLAADAWINTVLGDKLKSEAFAYADLLELMAGDEIAKVPALLESKEYAEAARILAGVRRDYRGTDASRDAKAMIDRYSEKHDAFKAAISAFGDERAAAKLLLDARDSILRHNFGDAFKVLDRIVKEFTNTEAAGHATDLIARMKENPAVWSTVRDKSAESDCRMWLSQARSYLKAGRTKEARELLERVMDSYPDTSYAEEAKRELIEMP